MQRNHLLNLRNESYYDKYRKKLDEFWQLQQIEKTDEECEYERLVNHLENMLNTFKDQIEELEKKNEQLQDNIGDVSGLREHYQQLKYEDSQLSQLQKEIENSQNY